MADQSVRVENFPDSGSKFRIAYTLMERIADAEYFERGSKSPDNPRKYYIDLYTECRRAVF